VHLIIKTLLRTLFLLGPFVLILVGCKKNEPMRIDKETQCLVDNAIADQEFMAIIPAVRSHALNSYGIGNQNHLNSFDCDSLTLLEGDINDYSPNPVYLMYLSKDKCSSTLPDGKIRTGKVKIRLTGKIEVPGSQMVIKIDEYVASGVSYFCDSITVTTLNSNPSFTSFQVILEKGSCKTSGYTINYSLNRTLRDYNQGDNRNVNPLITVMGSASGTSRHGVSFTTEITDSLVKHKNCPFIDKGTLEITAAGTVKRAVDFGNGTCDNEATFIVNENRVAFKLK
jgi:hypothetical protein